MSSRIAKIFARVRSYRRVAGSPDGAVEFSIEYTLATGSPVSGYVIVTPPAIVNERELSDDLKSALANELSLRYPPADFRPRDIVLAGI